MSDVQGLLERLVHARNAHLPRVAAGLIPEAPRRERQWYAPPMPSAVPLQEALGRLGELIDAADKETIIIVNGDRAVRLAPVNAPAKRARRAGSAAGRIHMADDFDAPLDDFAEYA